MNIRPKTVVITKVHGDCTSHARTDITVRDVSSLIDEPTERGGTNTAPTPTETLIASLVGCTNVITHKCAHANDVEIKKMVIDAEAKFDRRGVTLQQELDVPFPEITLKINITTDADEAALEKVKSDLNKFCPVAKVMRQAGTVINEEWTINRS